MKISISNNHSCIKAVTIGSRPVKSVYIGSTPVFNSSAYANIRVHQGILYNKYVIYNAGSVAASGWKVPDIADFDVLKAFLSPGSGSKLREANPDYWNGITGNTNASGFNMRGIGTINAEGVFLNELYKKENCFYHALNAADPQGANTVMLTYYHDELATNAGSGFKMGLPLRLLKETTSLSHGQSGTYTGNNGKVYSTICIGAQEWLAYNLCETRYRDGSYIPDSGNWSTLTTGARRYYLNIQSNAFIYI